jgi:hypothetical protein
MTMFGLAIFTDDYDPQRLYAADAATERDPALVESAVRFDDGPVDFLVDFEASGGRVIWSFRGKRESTRNRTEYFLADFLTDDPALFRSFQEALVGLPADWIVPYAGDIRWDLGFDLWRLPADTPGLSPADREQLFGRLAATEDDASGPLVFGVRDHRAALQVVRAIQEAGIECRVAVGTEGDPDVIPGLDLLLLPGGERDFEPVSLGVETVIGQSPSDPPAESTESAVPDRPPFDPALDWASRLAGALLLVLLAFAGYSFLSKDPVHPITGLSTVGGFFGAIVVLPVLGRRFGAADSTRSSAGPALPGLFGWSPKGVLGIVTYGTLWGFLFPTLFRVGGRVFTAEQWLFGSVSGFQGALLSATLFVVGLFGMATVALFASSRHGIIGEWNASLVRTLALAHVGYGVSLVLATGLARALWFHIIPSVAA